MALSRWLLREFLTALPFDCPSNQQLSTSGLVPGWVVNNHNTDESWSEADLGSSQCKRNRTRHKLGTRSISIRISPVSATAHHNLSSIPSQPHPRNILAIPLQQRPYLAAFLSSRLQMPPLLSRPMWHGLTLADFSDQRLAQLDDKYDNLIADLWKDSRPARPWALSAME